jgi:2-polyprenyl-3-methyl-5-hydroxy-6-metoxy-1,4-benzoquinol methylase
MQDWKQFLYANYVSTGQAGKNIRPEDGLRLSDYPYYTNLIAKYLPPQFDIEIADLACGHGALIFCLRELGYLNVKGVDLSLEQVKLAHRLGLTDIECQDMSGFLSANENAFDIVFLMDILEHLDRSELIDLLVQVRKSLIDGGLVIIHTPNAEGFFGLRMRYGDLTHEISFTSRSIRQVLYACGFEDVLCFEDKPVVHGLKSLFRYITWELLTFPGRLLLMAETGTSGHILSQNMLVTAVVP